jgi:hypothetical protein
MVTWYNNEKKCSNIDMPYVSKKAQCMLKLMLSPHTTKEGHLFT